MSEKESLFPHGPRFTRASVMGSLPDNKEGRNGRRARAALWYLVGLILGSLLGANLMLLVALFTGWWQV